MVEPEAFEDNRGFFYESYHQAVFAQNGITATFVQDNHSRSFKGVLRGLHFQIEPKAQAKLIRVVKGEIFDVSVDIRKNSKTFGRFVHTILSEKNRRMLYVPAGFAHGFCVLQNGSEFLYKVSNFYSPEHERGLIWNDPAIGIPWPQLNTECILSERDKKYPTLANLKDLF